MSRHEARHVRPGSSRRLKIGLFTVAVVAGAGVTVPALADTEPDVRLIVGLEASGKQATADRLSHKGYQLKKQGRLENLGARTLAVPEDDATKIAAKLRAQDGVAFVQLDQKRHVLGGPVKQDETPDPSPPPTVTDTPTATDSPSAPPTAGEDPGQPNGIASTSLPTSTAKPVPTVPPTKPETTEQALAQIGVPAALASGGSWTSQAVAVVDTGVSAVGPLAGAVLPGTNVVGGAPDPNDAHDDAVDDTGKIVTGHGTAVAYLIKSACPSCTILPVKAFDKRGTAYDSEIAQGITYAADQGAKVINLSFGAPVQPGTPDAGSLLQTAIDYARAKGAVVLAGAGNDARGNVKYYPAAAPGVLAVGGTNAKGTRYTTYDDPAGQEGTNWDMNWVDLAAPYCSDSIMPAGAPENVCGTSFSTAFVSGVAGLIKSRTPAATQWSIENALTTTATAPPTGDRWIAYGQIRADLAVAKVDTTAPLVGSAAPSYHQAFRGTFAVSAGSISDTGGGYPGGSGADHAWLYANGKYIGSDYSAPFAVNYNSGTTNGVVHLQWKVFDRAGNIGLLNRDAIADNVAPTLTWTSGPANNAKVKGTVTVKATAGDAGGVSRVELWINGKLTQWDWTSGYAFSINTAKYGSTIKVQLRANDKAGNVRALTTRTWKR